MKKALKRQKYYYVCNAFEERVKNKRNITTDSPAANGKVSRLCSAVRDAGGDARILSLGRGCSKKTLRRYPATAKKILNVPIVYADFWDLPLLSHLVSLVSLSVLMMRITERGSVLIFYNFQPHYLLTLLIGRISARKCILDLEDGCRIDDKSVYGLLNFALLKIFNFFCSSGVMLASVALKKQVSVSRTYVCHGVVENIIPQNNWNRCPLKILLGGSLLEETGAALLLEALGLLQKEHPLLEKKLIVIVTGFGLFERQFQKESQGKMRSFLIFKGNVSNENYQKIMNDSHVGLCLKLPSSSMGKTTFPSKVLELAASGLLVLSTKVSDVPSIFEESTGYLLKEATPKCLAKALLDIADHPEIGREIAARGWQKIRTLYSKKKIGEELKQFWQGN
jgi:glycosyltransferase involved in cell wall biosynthesis